MSKIIRVTGVTAPASAPRIIRTPGIGGYAARFIAGHLNAPEGSTVSAWDSVAGTVPTTLKPVSGKPSTVTVAQENGIRHVHSPGDGLNGGRLLGPHTAQRPLTLGAVVKVAPGTNSFMGIAGAYFTRNTTGTGNYTANINGKSGFPLVQRDGWVFLMFTVEADGSYVIRADSSEAFGTGAGTPPSSNGGLYVGSTEIGKTTGVREVIYWGRALALAERNSVHNYLRSRYPELV